METIQMKMAKASQQDVDSVIDFFQFLEEAIEHGTYTRTDRQGEQHTKAIYDEMLCGMVRIRWMRVSNAWTRVVFGCGVLIDNCCDPSMDHLAWKPEILKLLEAANESENKPQ